MSKTIGQRIRERREELNISQEELAKKVGYKSRSSINKLELCRDMPLNKVQLLANALDVRPGYLMGWTDEVDSKPNQIDDLSFLLNDQIKDVELTKALQVYFNLSEEKKSTSET